jgi:tetraacyldisaccharide 4'-kinase
MRDPAFWWIEQSTVAALLAPLARCYGSVVARHMMRGGGRKAPVPVICVGNFTLGGAGKTPTAIALANLLSGMGHRPFFLSRGYGGRTAGPILIDRQDAIEVGDEPLMLCRHAPTIVARNRPAGAIAAAEGGADAIIMDDGLQNPSLHKDLAIVVVDGRRGVGNGHTFPAGPLRAPLEAQLDHIDAAILVGPPCQAAVRAIDATQRRGVPVYHGDLRPDPKVVAKLAGKSVLAFAGIADPEKFFATLEAHGIPAPVRRPFPDHHPYEANEISALLACAERQGLELVTTEKDLARLRGNPAAADLIARSEVLPVSLMFRDVSAVEAILHKAMHSRDLAKPSQRASDAVAEAPPSD